MLSPRSKKWNEITSASSLMELSIFPKRTGKGYTYHGVPQSLSKSWQEIPYTCLKNKLQDPWKSSEYLTFIDLGNAYHVAKFYAEASKNKLLHEGPWFVVSVRKWVSNLVPQAAIITHIVIWARLPNLPTEFYDRQILKRVGEKLGTVPKLDACTSATLRGRYA